MCARTPVTKGAHSSQMVAHTNENEKRTDAEERTLIIVKIFISFLDFSLSFQISFDYCRCFDALRLKFVGTSEPAVRKAQLAHSAQ